MRTKTLTPRMAASYLKDAAPNRGIRIDAVRRYAADMTAGRWTEPTIMHVDTDGRLMDGQHRALAIIESGVSIPVIEVVSNHATFHDAIDGGERRTMSQRLDIMGYQYATDVAAAINAAATLAGLSIDGKYRNPARLNVEEGATRTLTNHEKLDILKQRPELAENVKYIKSIANRSDVSMSRGWIAGLMSVAQALDAEEEFTAYLAAVTVGDGLRADSPEFQLRRRLISHSTNPVSKLPLTLRCGLWVKAWNLSYMGEDVKNLKVSPRHFTVPIGLSDWVEAV